MAAQGMLGLARTVPEGMEPSSACACMSVLGYDPKIYYKGRGGIEARSMDIPVREGEVVFRCNLVAVKGGRMWSYASGYISTEESHELITAASRALGSDEVQFYPGVSYRHILKLRNHEDTLQAVCTPPHDIPDRPIADYLPKGPGSEILCDLMARSVLVLKDHPVNMKRRARGEIPATQIWLFWGTGRIPDMTPFRKAYGLRATMTSGVDLLRGLAKMASMDILEIKGVTDALDNDYAAQAQGALSALKKYDLVVIHIEAPDEAAHSALTDEKVKALERIDSEVVGRIREWGKDLRALIMPDHPTPIEVQTHTDDPVPFLMWGPGFASNGARRFTEKEAARTGFFLAEGYKIMAKFLERQH
jgi:2,3-bisphosphoglycerate-independent phosphoglycerate mutase